MHGESLFLVLVYKMSKAKSQIFMAYRRFYFILFFVLFLFYDDISDRRIREHAFGPHKI